MKRLYYWGVFVIVAIIVLVAICPRVAGAADYQAKIAKDSQGTQQVFLSENGGKDFYQLTWLTNTQAIWCKWSPDKKYLAIVICEGDKPSDIPGLNKTVTIDNEKSLGIFVTDQKCTFWIDGCRNTSWGDADVRNVAWVGNQGHTISYIVARFSAAYFKEYHKRLEITDKVLRASSRDFSPQLSYLGHHLIGAARKNQWADIRKLLGRLPAQKGVQFEEALKSNRAILSGTYGITADSDWAKSWGWSLFIYLKPKGGPNVEEGEPDNLTPICSRRTKANKLKLE
jgi:hypothetical protein